MTPAGPIVVIDDEDELREEIASYLHRRGYDVIQCGSAAEARRTLNTLTANGPMPVAVLCDETLSDGDGVAIFIDHAPQMAASRWFLMSGDHDSARLAADATGKGPLPPHTVLEKPFTLRSLVAMLACDRD